MLRHRYSCTVWKTKQDFAHSYQLKVNLYPPHGEHYSLTSFSWYLKFAEGECFRVAVVKHYWKYCISWTRNRFTSPGLHRSRHLAFSLTCSVNFLKADHEPSKSNGKSSFFPKIFGKNLLKKNALKGV